MRALSSERFERQNKAVEWDVEVILRPYFTPKWDVRASEPDEIPVEWRVFFHSAVNLTMPLRVMWLGL